MAGPLADVLVLDLSRILAGPYATMILGDLGATVIKVEDPEGGDDTRHWGPPFTPSGQSAYFIGANRNKRGIAVNLRSDAGREVIRDLARCADLLVENFKTGSLDRMGLGYVELHKENPGLVYCSISGFGRTGPDRDRPGYDNVIQAESGFMSLTGSADGEAFKTGVAVADLAAGLHAAVAMLAALHHREHSGEGQHVDIAIFDAQLSLLANVGSSFLLSGEFPRRQGNAHPSIVPYQVFATSDGRLMLAVGNDRQFAALCRVVGRAEWTEDPRFATNPARVMHREDLVMALGAILATRTSDAWTQDLIDAGVPCGPVNDVPRALGHRQAAARGMVRSLADPRDGTIRMIGPVAKLSCTPTDMTAGPPRLGEHTDAVLKCLLGYEDERLANLRKEGAIR